MKYKTGKTLTCPCCKSEFWLTSIEITFYAINDLDQPRVCRICKRKGEIESARSQIDKQPRVVNFK